MPPRNRDRQAEQRYRNRQECIPVPLPPHALMIPELVASGNALGMPWEVIEDEEVVITDSFGSHYTAEEANRILHESNRTATMNSIRHNQALASQNLISALDEAHRRIVEVEFDELSSRIQARATERPRGYWKLRNGKFIAISEMDDQHLENCIRLCERNSQSRGRRANPTTQGVYMELSDERARRRLRFEEHTRYLRQQEIERDRISRTAQNTEESVPELNNTQSSSSIVNEPESLAPPEGTPKRRIKS